MIEDRFTCGCVVYHAADLGIDVETGDRVYGSMKTCPVHILSPRIPRRDELFARLSELKLDMDYIQGHEGLSDAWQNKFREEVEVYKLLKEDAYGENREKEKARSA